MPSRTPRILAHRLRRKRATRPHPPARPAAETPAPPPRDAAGTDPFSPHLLEDRVVIKLLYEELIRIEQVEQAWYRWKAGRANNRTPLWRFLLEVSDLDRETIFAQAAAVYDFKPLELTKVEILAFLQTHAKQFTDAQWARMAELRLLPAGIDYTARNGQRPLIFATHDPTNPAVHRFLESLNLRGYELRYASETLVSALLAGRTRYTASLERHELALDYSQAPDDEHRIDEETLEAEINRSALIHLFETVLVEAVRQGASDIHIVPNSRRHIEILFRIDGVLHQWHVEERVHPEAFIAVVKDNAVGVDRFVRDRAQDGFIQRQVDGALIRFRVSVLPVVNARLDLRSESIVIRVLDDRKVIQDLSLLGLDEPACATLEWAIRQPYGMVILTGPTGSGKSTTLNALLNQVATPDRNVLSVEDPVEYVLPKVRQIKLSHNLTLDEALRAILRHDPDIVMVGEMRDRATAELAIKLANTGHLTFSTLHTNDAPSAVSRLYKMGVEPFLIAYAIHLVVAQRLLRILCPECKVPDEHPDPVLLERLGFTPEEIAATTFFKPGEKPQCSTCFGAGYRGRQAIAELLPVSEAIRHLIITAGEAIDEGAIRRQALKEGMITQQEAARKLIQAGKTSVEEVLRVIFTHR
ncbi:GspE/PulE family protein [Rhodocaloribacter litoris]|uniref:GspE/PulE family protein n=1 Tax=Rhodocaloribacter litoris TaxID=2558931 RepID=UPI001422C74E|nr:GspE/PulE family protein [Rhodocaloribacter litoris]QXD14488.1 GspE/PulE family protein [Rhodocaloribacter litoris]